MFFYRRIRFTAVVAASAMAMEISGSVKWNGDLVGYSDARNFYLVDVNTPDGDNAVKFAMEGEKAGASITAKTTPVSIDESAIWVKPIDALKLTVGKDLDFNAYDDFGKFTGGSFVCDYSGIQNLTLSLGLGGTLVSNKDFTGSIGVKAAYSADFGNIAASAGIKKDVYAIGLGYDGKTGPVDYTVAAGLDLAKVPGVDKMAGVVSGKAKVGYSADAFAADLTLTPKFAFIEDVDLDDPFAMGLEANASYAFGIAKAKLSVKDDNLLADDFAMTVTPSVAVEFSIGECSVSIEPTVVLGITDDIDFSFKTPVSFSVSL